MARKSAHPSRQLFDYLNGAASDEARQQVERHLSDCADCAAIARLVRALKDHAAEDGDPARPANAASINSQDDHPDVAALAAFFYSRSSGERDAPVAAHVAQCRHCVAEIALYAEAERAAAAYEPATTEADAVPAAVWEMLRGWEENAYAQPKPASEMVNHELLAKLMSVLREPRQAAGGAAGEGVVPVTIIDREGRVRGVELFKRDTDAEGESILRHSSASAQYDAKPVHVLLDFGDENHVILSERVERDTLRLKPVMRRTQPLRADYFIIED